MSIRDSLTADAVTTGLIRQGLEDREEALSPHAARSKNSRGRQVAEEPCPLRTEFQRDRDRIIHCKSFRRLKHKTQVFIAPSGDHYVTRLTHTLEVAQIARTISRALNLNEDLAEAIALGHDMGHTPFGHVGEEELDRLSPDGFQHSQQSLRIVEQLEKDGRGLNLTWEVRQGIVGHSKPRGDFLGPNRGDDLTLEAQVCRVADAVAYLNHDLSDAFRAGVLTEDHLPPDILRVLGERHSQRVNTMVCDIVESSWACRGEDGSLDAETPYITMSPEVRSVVNALREFMFEKVYLVNSGGAESQVAREVVQLLYHHFSENPDQVPSEYISLGGPHGRVVVDYIAGMTDRYSLRAAEEIQPGIAQIFRGRLL